MNALFHNSNLVSRFFDDPFDLLYKDFFDTNKGFYSFFDIEKISYPVDIKETDNSIEFDIAVVGLDKKDIKIEVKDNDMLCISYEKKKELHGCENPNEKYLYKGITSKSFNMAWRIGNKFDLSKLDAKMDKGMLKINIPIAPEKQAKFIEIKD